MSQTAEAPPLPFPPGLSGASAHCIYGWLVHGKADGSYPHDAGDFGRCEALLEFYPSLREKLPRMADLNAYWGALAPRWAEISEAPEARRTALIQSIVRPIEKADPNAARLSDTVLLHVGDITFKGAKMKHDPDFAAAQKPAMDATGAQLRQIIERFEQLEAEKKDAAQRQKEVMAEAKSSGFDTRVIRKIVALRKRKPDEIAEEEAMIDLYLGALRNE